MQYDDCTQLNFPNLINDYVALYILEFTVLYEKICGSSLNDRD